MVSPLNLPTGMRIFLGAGPIVFLLRGPTLNGCRSPLGFRRELLAGPSCSFFISTIYLIIFRVRWLSMPMTPCFIIIFTALRILPAYRMTLIGLVCGVLLGALILTLVRPRQFALVTPIVIV